MLLLLLACHGCCYANDVGAHYWNLLTTAAATSARGKARGEVVEEEQQEERERPRSVMWRATGGHQQRQLQPRVLVLDRKGNYSPHAYAASSLRTTATPAPPHHPQSGASVLWSGRVERVQMSDDQSQQRKGEGEERQRSGAKEGDGDEEEEEEGRAEEERRRAEAQVGAWGEYWGDGGAGAPLHPRCLWEVPHSLPLVTWDHGAALLRHHPDHREEVEDRLRFLLEECDCVDGFQLLVDVDDGWGGAASEVIELIRDDFPRTPLLTFALGHPRRSRTPVEDETRLINRVMALQRLSDRDSNLSSLVVPLQPLHWPAFPHLALPADSEYHSSAVAAMAIASATAPWSSRAGPSSMASVVTGELRVANMPVAALSLSLPFPAAGLRDGRVPSGMPLYAADFVRGLSFPAPLPQLAPAAEAISVAGLEASERWFTQHLGQYSVLNRFLFMEEKPVAIPSTYPWFFKPASSAPYGTRATAVPVLSHVQVTKAIAPSLQVLAKQASNVSKARAVAVAGEEWAEAQEQLHGLASAYTPDSDD